MRYFKLFGRSGLSGKIVLLWGMLFELLSAQTFTVDRIEPPNWWTGMRDPLVQVMVYGRDLDNVVVETDSPFLTIENVQMLESTSYLFVDIKIAPDAPSGEYPLVFRKQYDTEEIAYPLQTRDRSPDIHRGFSQDDIIYLITPDRFVNGDMENDAIAGMRDGWRPEEILGRHGGDIAGIMKKIPYLRDLGITTVWINPLVENDMPISYHGYAVTDHYRIDPRFGDNELYRRMVSKAHQYGIKVIIDHVSNHIGLYHKWMGDLPSSNWLNGSVARHQRTRHRKEVYHDIHRDSLELLNLKEGWFVGEMPDLNQRDPFLSRYLIQNTIWWLEFSGADGIREDTYPYADDRFLSAWAEAIFREYPDLNIVGEVWIHDPVFLASYMEDSPFNGKFNTNLPSVTDFGLFEAIGRVFNRGQSIDNLYHFLTRDFLYPTPDHLLIFADNHDVMRAFDLVGGDLPRYKMLFKILLTMRGIPQLYYGSEIGLAGGGIDHGEIRADFPGGFPGDDRDAFTAEGRTTEENEIFSLFRQLIKIRKQHPALQTGRLIHLPPRDEVYIYLRQTADQSVMVIVNNNPDNRHIDLDRVEHYFTGYRGLRELITNAEYLLDADLQLEVTGNDAGIYLLEGQRN